LECYDLASVVPKSTASFYDDVHFNEEGARVVAAHLVDYLLSEPPFAQTSESAMTMRHLVPVHGYGSLCLAGVGGLLVYLPFLWTCGFDAGERKQLQGQLAGFLMRPSGVNAVPDRSL
jgi:hypothetical protein